MRTQPAFWTRNEMAARAASLLRDGECVNLGIGIPTLVASHLHGRPILLHTENGLLGVGDYPSPGSEDPDVVNAGKEPVSTIPGASFFDSAMSFAMILRFATDRGGIGINGGHRGRMFDIRGGRFVAREVAPVFAPDKDLERLLS